MKSSVALLSFSGIVVLAVSAHALTATTAARSSEASLTTCVQGQSQDYSCLEENGAISWEGTVDEVKADELRKKGVCPCEDGGGGATTETIPVTSDESTLDVFANQHAVGAWGYATLVVKAFDAKGKPISSKTLKPGTKGPGFAAFKAEIKGFCAMAKKSGGVTFKFVTGKPRI